MFNQPEKVMQRHFRSYQKLGGKLDYAKWRDWFQKSFFFAA